MRVLVCGGRDYNRLDLVCAFLDAYHARYEVDILIHGAATGADTFAGNWAEANEIHEKRFPIWPGEGGFARNSRMLALSSPEVVVRFPGGNGTADMCTKAHAAGVAVVGGLKFVEAVQPYGLLI